MPNVVHHNVVNEQFSGLSAKKEEVGRPFWSRDIVSNGQKSLFPNVCNYLPIFLHTPGSNSLGQTPYIGFTNVVCNDGVNRHSVTALSSSQ